MTASASLNRHRVVALYAAGAAAWILGSDLVVTLIHGAPLSAVVPNSLKGLLFVAVTSLLLHLLLSPLPAQQAPADPGTPFRGSRLFAFIAAATVITASAGGVIWVMHAEHVAATEEALESVGKLKLELIQNEVAERKLDLDLLRDPRGSERPMAIQVTSGNPLERATARAPGLPARQGRPRQRLRLRPGRHPPGIGGRGKPHERGRGRSGAGVGA